MTAVDLITTVRLSPALMSSDSAERRVITDTTSCPATSTTISAITAPSTTLLTVPGNWFRALSAIVDLLRSILPVHERLLSCRAIGCTADALRPPPRTRRPRDQVPLRQPG